MDIEDFFKEKNKYSGGYGKRSIYENPRPYPGANRYRPEKINWLNIFNGVRQNKRIRNFLIVAFILVVLIVVGLIALLLPLLVKLFNIVMENGLAGGLDAVLKYVQQLLQGQ